MSKHVALMVWAEVQNNNNIPGLKGTTNPGFFIKLLIVKRHDCQRGPGGGCKWSLAIPEFRELVK